MGNVEKEKFDPEVHLRKGVYKDEKTKHTEENTGMLETSRSDQNLEEIENDSLENKDEFAIYPSQTENSDLDNNEEISGKGEMVLSEESGTIVQKDIPVIDEGNRIEEIVKNATRSDQEEISEDDEETLKLKRKVRTFSDQEIGDSERKKLIGEYCTIELGGSLLIDEQNKQKEIEKKINMSREQIFREAPGWFKEQRQKNLNGNPHLNENGKEIIAIILYAVGSSIVSLFKSLFKPKIGISVLALIVLAILIFFILPAVNSNKAKGSVGKEIIENEKLSILPTTKDTVLYFVQSWTVVDEDDLASVTLNIINKATAEILSTNFYLPDSSVRRFLDVKKENYENWARVKRSPEGVVMSLELHAKKWWEVEKQYK